MCDFHAYITKGGKEELYLESVVSLRPDDGTVYLKNLFGEEKAFTGRIKEVLLSKGRIIMEEPWIDGDL